jgi:hypothetical protein
MIIFFEMLESRSPLGRVLRRSSHWKILRRQRRMYGHMLVDVVGHTASLKKTWMREDILSVVRVVLRSCG